MLRAFRFLRPARPTPRPAARRAFRPRLEPLEDRLAPSRFAVIGDYGSAGAAEQHVANLVHSLNPDFVLTVGDNNYPAGAASTIDANVGQYYHDFIYPYSGGYGAGSPTGANRFFPTLGDHDWGNAYPDPTGDQPYLSYFSSLPGNGRYYTFSAGPAQFFALDSDPNEPDGNSSTSVQAQWLQSQLAASTATWKIVYFANSPYSTNLPSGWMQWPFQAWGATAVLGGHDHAYERLVEDNNFPYFVDGLGGSGHDSSFGSPAPGSEMRYIGDFGAMLVDAEADHVTFQLIGAWDHAGQVIDSYTIYTQPSAHVPDAPTGLTATAVSSSQVNLSWTDNSSNETGFAIQESLDGTNFTQVGTAAANAESFAVSGLSGSTTYYFRVVAVNAAGNSAPTNNASATTPSAQAPATPGNLTATVVSDTQVNLAWADNSTNENGFNIYASTSGGSYAVIATVGANVTAYSWTGATASTNYSFYVTAYNSAGESAASNTASTRTSPTGAPLVPSNLTATAVSGSHIDLSWTDNSSNEGGFKLYYQTDDGWNWFASASANATSYSWFGASPGTSYTFYITAYNSTAESAPSNTATATTPAPPAAPSNLTATAISGSRVDLAWADNSTNEDTFRLYYTTDGTTWNWFAEVAANTTTYTWWGASPSTTYTFRVTAHSSTLGDSAPSNTATATTSASAPAGPSRLLAAVVSSSQVNLSWADNSSVEDGFRIYESTDGTNFAAIATVGANLTSYSWTGAGASTNYSFYVTAYNSAGESAHSNTATATTSPAGAPLVPSNLAAAAVSATQLSLSWTNNATNQTGFNVYESTDGVNFTAIGSVGTSVTSFTWTGALATSYWFRVTATNAAGESAPSVPATAGLGMPTPAHVVVVVEENHSYSDIIGSSQAPYLNSLAAQGALMTNSFALSHPSQPNYLYLFSGSSQGVTDDNWPVGPFATPNLASELIAAGKTFGSYSEDQPSVGYKGGFVANYDPDHAPWVDFNNVPSSDSMPFSGSFPSDFSTLPTVSFVIPNLNDDMHNGTVQQGDTWLKNNIDAYAQWAKTHNSLLIVTWDEDDGSTANQIPTLIVGQVVQPGQYAATINHLSVLRSIEDMYQLPYAGQSAGVTPITSIWAPATPAAPSGLAATAAANGRQVSLTWTDNSTNETGFNVYESTDGVNFTAIGNAGANVTTYTWTAAAPGTTYSFRVTAVNATGESAASNTAVVTTPAAPAAPSALTATAAANGRQVSLSWTDNSSNETGFNVYESTDGVTFTAIATVGANVTTYTWAAASPGTAYSFRVTAVNAVGESAASNTATVTTPAAPAAPSALTATAAANGRQVSLTWTDNSNNETGFNVYESTNGVNFTLVASVGTNVTAYTWTAASPGTTYSFRVTAFNAVGESATSNTTSVTTPTAPAAPSGLAATAAANGQQVSLSWTDNSTNETGFNVYESTNGVNFTLLATTAANVTAYTWTAAVPGTTYSFRVTAVNAVGESAASNTVSVTMPAAPAAPSNLSATAVSATQVNLAWTDNSTNETGFKVYESTNGGTYTLLATVGANVTTYSWTGASTGHAYSFYVTAYNAVGESAHSNTASVSPPAAPSNLVAKAVSNMTVNLTWTDNSNNESGFMIEFSLDGVNFTQIATVGPNVTSYSVGGLLPLSTYYFRVRAYNVLGDSAYSNTASATTPLL